MSKHPESGEAGKRGVMATQVSQSLFQVYYLGSTAVDRHCSPAVMSWITEEMKLRTEQRILTWLTSGDTRVSYVADSGVELFHHPHTIIFQCAMGTDSITFSYIVRELEGKYSCHVFQCLTPDEAVQVMKKFKMTAKGDRATSPSPANLPPPADYSVHYVGSMEIESAAPSSELLDNALEKFRRRQRKLNRKEVSAPHLRKFSEQEEGSSGDSVEVLDPLKSAAVSNSPNVSNVAKESAAISSAVKTTSTTTSSKVSRPGPVEVTLANSENSPEADSQSISSQSIQSLTDRQMHMTREDSCDVAITLTRATPDRGGGGLGNDTREGTKEGAGEREGEVGKEDVDSGGMETFVQNLQRGSKGTENEEPFLQYIIEPPSPTVSTPGGSEAASSLGPAIEVLYHSDADENLSDSHTTGSASSTSCTTPDPLLGDSTPTDSLTPTHSNPTMFQRQNLKLKLLKQQDDRPTSCPPLEPDYATEEVSIPFGEEEEEEGKLLKTGEEEGEMDGERKANREREYSEGEIVSSPIRPSASDDNIMSRVVGSVGSRVEGKKQRRKIMGRSRSFERPRTQQHKGRVAQKGVEETDVGFDTLPELKNLQKSPEFLALGDRSHSGGRKWGGRGRAVRLVISPAMVQVIESKYSAVILKRTIRSIACCAQGQKKVECVGFVSREGQAKTFVCHIFKAASQAMATAVMDSFKSSFVQALNTSPTAMCESCPLQQLHLLCQNLEDVPTSVAQSRIQECLSHLSEADYNCIMSEYKSHEHADHEFTQLVVLVSLIREHLQKKQQEHIHPVNNHLDTSTNTYLTPKPTRLSKLERAKLALASSFENLRKGNKSPADKRNRQFGKSVTVEESGNGSIPSLATEDRRASFDPSKLAKKKVEEEKLKLDRTSSGRLPAISGVRETAGDSSGGEEGKGRTRAGSWLQRLRGSKPASSSQEDVSKGDKQKPASSSQEDESKGDKQKPASSLQEDESKGDKQKPASSSQEDESDGERHKAEDGREASPLASPQLQERSKVKPAMKLDSKEDSTSRSSSRSPSPTLANRPPPLSITSTSPLPPSTPPPPSGGQGDANFKTPTRTPMWRKHNVRARRAHTKASFSPPPGELSSPMFEKYRREHKRSESISWRHEIFESVTPVKERSTEKKTTTFQDWEIIEPTSIDQLGRRSSSAVCEGSGSPRSVTRERWRRAIEQQIMLQRMEKENQSIMKANTEADTKRLKLCYTDPSIQEDSAGKKWAELLSRPHPPEQSELRLALMEGVIPGRRGEVWSLLIQLYQDTHPSLLPHSLNSHSLSLSQLCQKTTDYDTVIGMDLGRTFPSHPYFSTVEQRGGQQALANILHAYAVSDEDTGYCQGLSFIAGMILMHTKDEESAFKLLCQFMHIYSYRDVYSPDLSVLQLQLYQLSRLLHDVLPTLHSHLTGHEITPFYYAAPWFLTLFSSQFPIAFVARVMDLFFLDGPDIVFKVSVALLRYYETHILRCRTMESISEFLKGKMPQLILDNMPTVLEDALNMDLGNKLTSYETEYFVLEELTTSFQLDPEAQDLKALNESFRNHNKELIEQLAFCRGLIGNLESTVATLQEAVKKQDLRIEKLEAAQQASSSSLEGSNTKH